VTVDAVVVQDGGAVDNYTQGQLSEKAML